jgi:hypothetical protein
MRKLFFTCSVTTKDTAFAFKDNLAIFQPEFHKTNFSEDVLLVWPNVFVTVDDAVFLFNYLKTNTPHPCFVLTASYMESPLYHHHNFLQARKFPVLHIFASLDPALYQQQLCRVQMDVDGNMDKFKLPTHAPTLKPPHASKISPIQDTEKK